MTYALVTNGEPVLLALGQSFVVDDVHYPANVLTLWPAQELAAIGVYPVTDTVVPAGKRSVSSSLVFDGESVQRVHVLEDIPAEEVKAGLIAYAAQKRYEVETAGVTVGGAPIATDRESQALISGAFALAKDDPEVTIRFKSRAGFVSLSADQMLAIGRMVAAHVQACFATEAEVTAGIDDGTITSVEAIDAAFAQI